ncbi:MAG: ABC transporter substrate-binding protein [Alphaproteobacteria bacterium]|nr:ABC transporter substrate-binding protein [Alphaproteobacteria bacterium]
MQGSRGFGALSRRRMMAAGGAFLLAPAGGCCLFESPLPVVGYLDTPGADSPAGVEALDAFRRGMADEGLVEGDSYTLQTRVGEARPDQLPTLAKDLLDQNVILIFAGSAVAARAAMSVAQTVPIVFGQAGDPVENGEVSNVAQPEGNLTGIANFNDLDAKRIRLLNALVPAGSRIAYLSDTNLTSYTRRLQQAEEEAGRLNHPLLLLKAGNDTELAVSYSHLNSSSIGGLVVSSIRGLRGHPQKLVELAARHKLPAVYFSRAFVDLGGLMSYGPSYKEIDRLAGRYAARILKGARPADLPVLQPNAFELAVNKTTAASLGLTIPPEILAEASELVE